MEVPSESESFGMWPGTIIDEVGPGPAPGRGRGRTHAHPSVAGQVHDDRTDLQEHELDGRCPDRGRPRREAGHQRQQRADDTQDLDRLTAGSGTRSGQAIIRRSRSRLRITLSTPAS
ncbi:hypothetical protein ACIRL2_43760 [Embleya sp. NPDC127516]|uniref:hypothetical protein n=1 Tax=Embleya sp. NPDC127516 TaxID=3363990 RepID=UPI0038271C7B